MIDLEDFSPFLEVDQKLETDNSERKNDVNRIKEIEAAYREELLRLQTKYKKELERVKEEAYRKGFQEGAEKTRLKLEEELKITVQKLESEYLDRLRRLEKNLNDLISQVEKKGEQVINNFLKSVSNSLVEILEFLYTSPENAPFVKEKLEELISSFTYEDLISVEVGRELGKVLKGENVTVNPELGDNDFRLNFKDFILESKVKDKLKLLREELEREIKKLT